MSQSTPELLITNAGLAVASVAMPQGPYIHIVGFRIGSAFGYDPDRGQQSLRGTQLYSDQVQAWNNIGDGTIDIVCRIQPEAGPFQFGEVGLYLADANGQFSDQSVLFAIAAFDEPQTKFSSLGTNVVSSYTFHCLLKLEQSTAVFKIDTSGGDPISVDQYCWSDVYPPSQSANPNVQLYNVKELSVRGDGSLLIHGEDAQWTLASTSYNTYSPRTPPNGTYFTVADASSTWIEVPASQCHPQDIGPRGPGAFNRSMVVRTAAGFFRSTSSIAAVGANYRFYLNTSNDGTYNNYPLPIVPRTGEQIRIYRADQTGGSVYYSQIVDPPPMPLAVLGTPGSATAGTGLTIRTPGIMEAYGLLQDPSQASGHYLTGSDDLNNLFMNSGWYTMGALGFPQNMPPVPQMAGHLFHMTEQPVGAITQGKPVSVTQVWYPSSAGGGDSQGRNGYPVYWREYNELNTANGLGGWTQWFAFMINGKQGMPALPPVNVTGLDSFAVGNNYSSGSNFIPTKRCMWMLNLNDGGGGGDCYVTAKMSVVDPNNFVIVGRATRYGGAGYGRWASVSGMLNAGDTINIRCTDWSNIVLYFYYF